MTVEQKTQNHAYVVVDENEMDGTVTVRINKGILGALGNQLKSTSDKKRKGASILRKLGYDLSEAGDRLYNKETQQVN
jgi:hypothetical protein